MPVDGGGPGKGERLVYLMKYIYYTEANTGNYAKLPSLFYIMTVYSICVYIVDGIRVDLLKIFVVAPTGVYIIQ